MYLQILKNLAQFFCLSPFQILQILKTPLFILITIYIKTIIQIHNHKVKYILTACIPIIIINFFYFFTLLYIGMNRNSINFDNKNIEKSEFYNKNKKIFNIDVSFTIKTKKYLI